MRRKPFGLFHFSYSCGDERGGNHWWWRILWPSLYGQNSFSLIWNVQTLNQRHDRSSIGCSTESVSDIASKIISKIIYIFRRILIYNTCVLDGVLKMEFLLVHYMELSDKCVWRKWNFQPIGTRCWAMQGKYTESTTFIVTELLIRQLYFPDGKEVGQRN